MVVRLIVLANVLKTSAALCVRKHSFSSIIVSPSSSSSALSSDRRLKFVGRCGSLAVVVVIIVLHRSFWLALVAGNSLPGDEIRSDDDNVGDDDSAGIRGRLLVLAVVVVGVDRLRDDRCDDDWDGSFSFSFSSEKAATGELPNDFSNCRCGATSRDVLADRVADDGSVVGFSGGGGGAVVVLGVASVVVVVVVNVQSGLVVGVDLAFCNTDARVLDVASIKVGYSSSTSGELMGVASVMDRSGTSSNTSSSSSSSSSTCSFAVFV